MRVIAGKAKGRRLYAPKGEYPTRPVLDQVKEAVFNILFDVSDLRVLDLFAGTGSVGIEALSRGAKSATFVEKDRRALMSLNKNLLITGFGNNSAVLPITVERAVKKLDREKMEFDLIFIDPPYLKNCVNPTLSLLSKTGLLSKNGLIIIEHSPREEPVAVFPFTLTETRKYGQSRITFLRKI